MNEMERALIADGEKLLALTGEDHGPFCPQCMGDGYFMVPVCCNNPTRGGECCGNALAGQEVCETCGGTGKLQGGEAAGSPTSSKKED